MIKDQPDLARQTDGTYLLAIGSLTLPLTETELRTIALQALRLLPDITPQFAVPNDNEVYRLPARKLALLDEHSIQAWLREIDAETIKLFVWFMNDEALATKVIRNLSAVAGQMLLEDLTTELGEWDPDTAPLAHVVPGRRAATVALETYEQLRRTGAVRSL